MKYLKYFETNYTPFGKFKVGDIVNFPWLTNFHDNENVLCIISDYNYLYTGYNKRNEPIKDCVSSQPIKLKTINADDELEVFAYSSEDYITFVSSVRTDKILKPLTKEEEDKFRRIFKANKYNL